MTYRKKPETLSLYHVLKKREISAFFQTPHLFLKALGSIVLLFIGLGFLFQMTLKPQNTQIPIIQACPGPIRIRPPENEQKTSHHHVYSTISTSQVSQKKNKLVLLPPVEAPLMEEHAQEKPNSELLLEKKTSSAGPASSLPSQNNGSLDDLLKQIDEVLPRKK